MPAFVAKALRDTAIIELRNRARLLEDGRIVVTFRALCPEGFQAVELGAPVALTQGAATGEGLSGIECTGHWEWRRVFVSATDEPQFQPGTASARVFFSFENPVTGELLDAEDAEVLTIR